MLKQNFKSLILIIVILFTIKVQAQNKTFQCIVLGSSGGTEGNSSAYMLAPLKSTDFICLDAGTLLPGIGIALKEKCFGKPKLLGNGSLMPEHFILRNYIKSFLISHTHIDHIAGLVSYAPFDASKKTIMALPKTFENINNHVFNWKVAANFGSEGIGVPLKKYKYIVLQPGIEENIPNTELFVTPFYTSHGIEYLSSAFLIRYKESYFLYFGDSGSDEFERSDYMAQIWSYIAPLIRDKKLKAIMIECSFTNEQQEDLLYGHLKPSLLMRELNQLAKSVNEKEYTNALKGLKVMIVHIKPSFDSSVDNVNTIKYQLENSNFLGVKFSFPVQGEKIEF